MSVSFSKATTIDRCRRFVHEKEPPQSKLLKHDRGGLES